MYVILPISQIYDMFILNPIPNYIGSPYCKCLMASNLAHLSVAHFVLNSYLSCRKKHLKMPFLWIYLAEKSQITLIYQILAVFMLHTLKKTIQVSTNQFREVAIIGDHHFVYWLSLTEFWRLSLTSFVTLVSNVDSCREKI